MRVGGVIAVAAAAVAALFVSGAGAVNIVTDVVLPKAEVNGAYEFAFEAFEGCGPYEFSVTSGTLPPGFRLLPDGRLLGTGTKAGTFAFTVSVSDRSPNCPSEPARGTYTLDVLPDLAITTESLPAARLGSPYRATLAIAGRDATVVRWTIVDGSLPPGLQLGQDGIISGTPTVAGPAGFVVKIEEPFRRQDLKYLTLPVASGLAVGPLPARVGELGVRFSATLAQSGGVAPVRWTMTEGSLPLGLVLDRTSGVISGRPLAAGTFSVTLQASDATGTTGDTTLGLRFAPRLRVATRQLAAGVVDAAYTARLRAAGGVGPVRWKLVQGRLPRGIGLDAAGRFRGTTDDPGTYRIWVRATDALGVASRVRLALVIV
jgi:hypothetical protein